MENIRVETENFKIKLDEELRKAQEYSRKMKDFFENLRKADLPKVHIDQDDDDAKLSPRQLLNKYKIFTIKDWKNWMKLNNPDKNSHINIDLVKKINSFVDLLIKQQ